MNANDANIKEKGFSRHLVSCSENDVEAKVAEELAFFLYGLYKTSI